MKPSLTTIISIALLIIPSIIALGNIMYINFFFYHTGFEQTFSFDRTSLTKPIQIISSPRNDLDYNLIGENGLHIPDFVIATIPLKKSNKKIHYTVKVDGENVTILEPKLSIQDILKIMVEQYKIVNSTNNIVAYNVPLQRLLDHQKTLSPENKSMEVSEVSTACSIETPLEFVNTSEIYENKSFIIGVNWTRNKPNIRVESIVSHFNWEVLEDDQNIIIQSGRNLNTKEFKRIIIPLLEGPKPETHELLIINNMEQQYSDIYLDSIWQNRYYYEDKIDTNYGTQNLKVGMSGHPAFKSFSGCINQFIAIEGFLPSNSEKLITITGEIRSAKELVIPLDGPGTLKHLNIQLEETQ